jgi:hypothetical protein
MDAGSYRSSRSTPEPPVVGVRRIPRIPVSLVESRSQMRSQIQAVPMADVGPDCVGVAGAGCDHDDPQHAAGQRIKVVAGTGDARGEGEYGPVVGEPPNRQPPPTADQRERHATAPVPGWAHPVRERAHGNNRQQRRHRAHGPTSLHPTHPEAVKRTRRTRPRVVERCRARSRRPAPDLLVAIRSGASVVHFSRPALQSSQFERSQRSVVSGAVSLTLILMRWTGCISRNDPSVDRPYHQTDRVAVHPRPTGHAMLARHAPNRCDCDGPVTGQGGQLLRSWNEFG